MKMLILPLRRAAAALVLALAATPAPALQPVRTPVHPPAGSASACAPTRAPSAAQDPVLLPVSELPLSETPPASRFIALARERAPVPRDDWSDMQATLWEIDPERTEEPAVRRHVFGRSHWRPRPLICAPEVLRWQVPGGVVGSDSSHSVKLLGVDYSSFEVTELLTTRRVREMGRSGDRIYLDTSAGQLFIDGARGVPTPQEPEIHRLASHGVEWLVEVDGLVARFDASKGEIVRRYPGIPMKRVPGLPMPVHWDGGPTAVMAGRCFDESGDELGAPRGMQWQVVYRELSIWDLEAGTARSSRVRTQASMGSGVLWVLIDMDIEIERDLLRYTERFPAAGTHADLEGSDHVRDFEWVTVSLATGEEQGREPCKPAEPIREEWMIPDYLGELFLQRATSSDWSHVSDLARAFLEYHGIELDLAGSGSGLTQTCCRTSDGRELLVLHQGTFYHCDLETRALIRWPAPTALIDVFVDLYAVDVQ